MLVGLEIDFCDEEQLFTVNSALSYTVADRSLVSVGFRCVYHPISCCDCFPHGVFAVFTLKQKCTKSDLRHFYTVIQNKIIHVVSSEYYCTRFVFVL